MKNAEWNKNSLYSKKGFGMLKLDLLGHNFILSHLYLEFNGKPALSKILFKNERLKFNSIYMCRSFPVICMIEKFKMFTAMPALIASGTLYKPITPIKNSLENTNY